VADVLGLTAVLGGMLLILAGLVWLALRAKRRGVAGAALSGALAAFDEGWHSTAHDAHVEQRARTDRKAPAPSPDDL
jgi:hypothetical protein